MITTSVIAMIIAALVCLIAYFLPTVIASCRDHKNTFAIFLANLFFGWTAIGWILALIWSFTSAR